MNNESTIKRCPKCEDGFGFLDSHNPTSDHPELEVFFVECDKCDYKGEEDPTKQGAIDNWNDEYYKSRK